MRDLELAPDYAMVTFEFAALNFVLPEKNTYSYRLEGFDHEWSPASSKRTATYTSLPPGDFVFRVRAANNDGAWNQNGLSLVVHRRARFRETYGFVALVALILVAAAWGTHRLRVRHHLHLELELERRFAEAVSRLKTLTGLLPICGWCKRIRDDSGYWSQLEEYLSERSDAEVVRSLCPECRELESEAPDAAEGP